MSFDQSLIRRGKGVYAFMGSQALAKFYKSNDIESVNVPKTCDALRSALRTDHIDSQSVVKENVIPFRICTNLMFGTLKIYQQQVNNLYKLSEDLVIRSSKYDVNEPRDAKRNKHSSHKSIKRRRLTISNSNDYGANSNINYSEILEDLERLAQEAYLEEDETSQNDIPARTQPLRQPLAHLQIREITIREINATYGIPELDNDCGFGEASNEDMLNFFTFAQDEELHATSARGTPAKRKIAYENAPSEKQRRLILSPEENHHTSFTKRTPTKRKGAYEEDIVKKQSRLSHDSSMDKLRRGSYTGAIDLMTTPCRFGTTMHEGTESPPHENTFCPEDTIFGDNTNTTSVSPIKEEYEIDQEIPIPLTPNMTMDVKFVLKQTVKDEFVDVNAEKNMKSSMLIIDHCIKLEEEFMLEQLLKPKKELRGITSEIFRKSKTKKRIPAIELLKRFNKRTLLFCLTLKQKPLVDIIKCQQEYLNLLHDILKTDYKEEWASEVYPKWRKGNCKTPQKHKKKEKVSNKETEHTINCNFINENYNVVVHNDDNYTNWDKNNPPLDSLNYQIHQKKADDSSEHYITSTEWRPYGVMTKLLKIWRYSTKTEINANEFCHSAKAQIDKALAFSSLLNLSKSHFISITHHFKTIEMDKIILGITARDLMKST